MLNEFLFRHSIMGIFLSENMPLLAISVLSINALSCWFFTLSLPDISIAYRAIQPKVERVLEESNSDYTFRSFVRSFVRFVSGGHYRGLFFSLFDWKEGGEIEQTSEAVKN